MNNSQMQLLALAVGFSVSLVSLIAILLSPKTSSTHFYISNTTHIDPKMVKLVNLIGGDLLSLMPKDFQKRSIASKEVDDIFRAAGNPWGVTKLEFYALRVAYAFVGGGIAIIFSMIVRPGMLFFLVLFLGFVFLGSNKPLTTYRKIAKNREKDFKKHFPEMLDYLTMIMNDGTSTFANAIETVLPYLPESSVKLEFSRVTDSINAGLSTDEALSSLAIRLPSPALEAFVNAVNNANTLNTPMDGLMRTQAKKSREDLLNELELIIQGLPTKTMLTIAPATIFSMLAIFMIPVVMALLQSL